MLTAGSSLCSLLDLGHYCLARDTGASQMSVQLPEASPGPGLWD